LPYRATGRFPTDTNLTEQEVDPSEKRGKGELIDL
jgi:hypothetical protein